MKFQLKYIFSFLFLSLFFQYNSLAQVGVNIEEGELTNKREIQLNINIPEAYKMKISENFDFSDCEWIGYQNTYFWTLSEGDGAKEVFLKFRLKTGVTTDTFVGFIHLDTKPPYRGRVNFSRGNYTKYRSVEIDFKCEEATWMNISNTGIFNKADWRPFRKHLNSWLLPSGDGIKKIYVKFKDDAGNETKVYVDHIKLDTKAPIPQSIDIVADYAVVDEETGIMYVNSHNRQVALEMRAKGAEYMKVSNSLNFYGQKWRRYRDYMEDWLMEDDVYEGYKRVYIRFRDKAGNESGLINTAIYIDTKPPINPRIAINNGDEYTKSTNVSLQLHATDAVEMRLSNDKAFHTAGEWEPFSKVKMWTLAEGETGDREVWVKYRDRAKNQSRPIMTKIRYDKDSPTNGMVQVFGDGKTTDNKIRARVKAKDALMMKVALAENFENAHWREFSTVPFDVFIGNQAGYRVLKAQFRDRARNVSEIYADSIFKEVRPLSPRISIDNNKEYNTRLDGKVELSLFCLNATHMKIGDDELLENSEWQEYTNKVIYHLKEPDGIKTLYAKFKSETETISQTVSDKINWDKTPPFNSSIELKVLPTESRIYYTKDYIAQVKSETAVAMQITEDSTFYTASWMPYTELPFFYGMSVKGGPIGYRTLYVRFKDFAGNISEPLVEKLYFDATSPQDLHVNINVPDLPEQIAVPSQFTFIRDVALDMEFKADSAYYMRISDHPYWIGAEWLPYDEEYNYPLMGDEGKKRIFIQFKDDHDNVTRIIKKDIVWDRDPPSQPQLIIDKGQHYTRASNREVILNPICMGADFMVISNNPDFSDGYWTHYRSRVRWLLTEGDGEKTIYAKFYDYAGNESFETRGQIILDRTVPMATEISINDNEVSTNSLEVNLKLNAENATEMIICNDYSFASPSTWEPFRRTKKWKINNQDGEAKVYFKVKNQAGTVSEPISASIILDTSHPILHHMEFNDRATGTESLTVTVKTKVTDDTVEMQLSNSNDFSSAQWINYKPEVEWTLAGRGRQYVWVRFKDENGNISQALSKDIVVFENVK
ncbi:hypothetical protein [Flammeovirga aprica]|uniref:Ig-like domain-containing protein n=1 Tax=Flammeovirga aprica JL-4 TaxID=694437 RepID=A0A7X9RWR6_9BACT|nr:hypothetical protein [Flammeovirga aprica]NME70114.1 hypothetical protein [Flammeovirga aprica JL-4]